MTELESDQATSIRGFGCKVQKLVKENEVLEERLKDLVRQNRALKSVSRRVGRGGLGMKRGREETVGSDSGCGETGRWGLIDRHETGGYAAMRMLHRLLVLL